MRIVFLISVPRSGSTLLQHVLASHSKVSSTTEPWVLLPPLAALRPTPSHADYDARSAHVGLTEFLGRLPEGRARYLEGVRQLGLDLYGSVLAETGALFFVDKNPRYYLILPELVEAFPDARFLFLFRNPLAVLASVLETFAAWRYEKLTNPGIRSDLVDGQRLLREGARLVGERAALVRYEDLVAAPEETTRRLCAWLLIEFEPEMLEYGRGGILPGTLRDPKSIHKHRTVVTDYADTWKRTLSRRRERAFARAVLGHLGSDLLEWLGYPLPSLEAVVGPALRAPGALSRWTVVTTPAGSRSFAQRLRFAAIREVDARSRRAGNGN